MGAEDPWTTWWGETDEADIDIDLEAREVSVTVNDRTTFAGNYTEALGTYLVLATWLDVMKQRGCSGSN